MGSFWGTLHLGDHIDERRRRSSGSRAMARTVFWANAGSRNEIRTSKVRFERMALKARDVRRGCLLADDGMLSRIWIRISVGIVSIMPGVMLVLVLVPVAWSGYQVDRGCYLKLEGISPSVRNEKTEREHKRRLLRKGLRYISDLHLPIREQSPEADVLFLLQTPSPYRFSCKTNQQQIVNDQP